MTSLAEVEDSKLLAEQAQGPVGEEGHPSSKQCDPRAELADSRDVKSLH